MLLFYPEPILDVLLILFNFAFFFLWQVFITLFCLFFYSFFVLFIILSSFFFWVLFFCFLQDLSIKPVIIHYYALFWQLIKKIFVLLIHNFILIFHFYNHPLSHSHFHSHFLFIILVYHILLNYLIFHYYVLIWQLKIFFC